MASKPKHFDSDMAFSIYILRCAIRDRVAFLDAIEAGNKQCVNKEWYDANIREIELTKQEINSMESRLRVRYGVDP